MKIDCLKNCRVGDKIFYSFYNGDPHHFSGRYYTVIKEYSNGSVMVEINIPGSDITTLNFSEAHLGSSRGFSTGFSITKIIKARK